MAASTEPSKIGVMEMVITGVVAALYKTAMAPFDRVKLLVQLQSELPRHRRDVAFLSHPVVQLRPRLASSSFWRGLWAARHACVPRSMEFGFNGSAIAVLEYIWTKEGARGFFRGNQLAVASVLFTGPLQIAVVTPVHHVVVTNAFQRPDAQREPLTFFVAHTAAALLSGLASAVIVYPLEVGRVALAGDVSTNGVYEYRRAIDFGRCVYRHDFASVSGIRAQELGLTQLAPYACLYRGLMLGFIGQVMYRSVFWGLYETMGYLRGSERFSSTQEFFASYALTGFATLLLYPLDTVRRCYMRAGVSSYAAIAEQEMVRRGVTTSAEAALNLNPDIGARLGYRTLSECVARIWSSEGPVGFFRGAATLPVRSLGLTCLAFLLPRFLGRWTLA